MEQLTWKLLALQMLVYLMDVQCPVDADVSLSLNDWAYLQLKSCKYILLHVITCYYILMLPRGLSQSQSKTAMSMGSNYDVDIQAAMI